MNQTLDFLKSSEFTWGFTVMTALFTWYKCVHAYRKAFKKYNDTRSQQVLNGVPGHCVSWGVLFTFVSIVVSLTILVYSDNEDDFSIFRIASTLIPAFITSVEGNAFSIRYSIRIREILANEELDDYNNFGEPTRNISKMLTELMSIKETQSQQNSVFQRFMDTFTEKLSSTLTDTKSGFAELVTKGLCEELAKVSDMMNVQVNKIARIMSEQSSYNKKVLDQLISETKDTYGKTCNQIKSELVTVKENVIQQMKTQREDTKRAYAETIAELKANMSAIGSKFAETTEAMNKKLHNSTENLQLDIKTINDNVKTSVESMVGQLNEALQTPLELFMRDVEFMQGKIGQICTQYEQAMVGYRDALKTVHKQSDLWEQSGDRMKQLLDTITSNQKDLNRLIDITAKRQENMTALETQIQQISAAIGELQKLNAVLTNLSEGELVNKKVV